MDYLEVEVLSDDGEHTTRTCFIARHVLMFSEVHPTMVDMGDVPAKAKSIILIRGLDDPIPVTDTYDELFDRI